MSKKKALTTGVEWLGYSIVAFNGSGYADRDGAEEFVDSYIAYKTMKNDNEAVNLATNNRELIETMADKLLDGFGPSHQASKRGLMRFAEFYIPAKNWLI